jgi:ribosomal protein S18 acetylase RimI-like enzyme
MDFLVRAAVEQDFEGISEIFNEVNAMHSEALPSIFVEPKEPVESACDIKFISDDIADENTALFVAERDGQIIGIIHVSIRESPEIPIMVKRRYGYIDDIAIAKEFRNSSIGKTLMREVERWAIQKNVSQLELNVWDFNQNAFAFFQKLGYTAVRHIMGKSIH